MEISTTKFELLEINLISALYITQIAKINLFLRRPPHLRRRLDRPGAEAQISCRCHRVRKPEVEQKVLFVADTKTLNSWSTAELVIELYCIRRSRKDRLIGTSRVLVGSFGNCGRCYYERTTGTFRVFYIRFPNGEPRGVLNIGITILDGLLPYQVISDQFMGIGSVIDCQKLLRDGTTVPARRRRRVFQFREGCLAA